MEDAAFTTKARKISDITSESVVLDNNNNNNILEALYCNTISLFKSVRATKALDRIGVTLYNSFAELHNVIKTFKKVVKTSITKEAFKALKEANIKVIIDTRNTAEKVN